MEAWAKYGRNFNQTAKGRHIAVSFVVNGSSTGMGYLQNEIEHKN